MKESWEDKADENAYHWVDSSKESWYKKDYYQKGMKEALDFAISFLKENEIKEKELKEMRALDLGCGTGRITLALAEYFQFVDGIDISEKMIKIAKKDHSGIKNLKFHIGNGIDLKGFSGNFFDFIFSFLVFQHIPKKSIIINYLKEIHRVLKTGRYVKIQTRGYPGHLPPGLPSWRYKGFNSFYIALSKKKNIFPFPVVCKYDTVYGAFFKGREIKEVFSSLNFSEIKTFYHPHENRYLWVSAKK